MSERIPAEVFPPGEFIKDELDARGWTQGDLAEIMGRPNRLISMIVTGKKRITPETAQGLGEAFGTGAQFWMNLQNAYLLSMLKGQENSVARKAALYSKAPIKDMIRRQWIEPSQSAAVLEKQILDFFGLPTLADEPEFCVAARKSTSYGETTPPQRAWLQRARNLAPAIHAEKHTKKRFAGAIEQLKALAANPEDVRRIPKILAEAGIRFLILEHLPKTRIDGACLWLNRQSPVIVVSLRYDRIDFFWHTLGHELGHVYQGDGLSLDIDLVGAEISGKDERTDKEQEADRFATELLVSPDDMSDFVARVRPLYSKKRIQGFAARIGVHPGIVVGQLQHRNEVSYSHSREMLVKVRHLIVGAALTDGWGHTPPRL